MKIQIIKEWSGVVVLILLVTLIGFFGGMTVVKITSRITTLETQTQEARKAIEQITTFLTQQVKVGQTTNQTKTQ